MGYSCKETSCLRVVSFFQDTRSVAFIKGPIVERSKIVSLLIVFQGQGEECLGCNRRCGWDLVREQGGFKDDDSRIVDFEQVGWS